MIQITYPNEGVYEGGKPRFEQIDDKTGELMSCRIATDQEALMWMLYLAINELNYTMLSIHGRV